MAGNAGNAPQFSYLLKQKERGLSTLSNPDVCFEDNGVIIQRAAKRTIQTAKHNATQRPRAATPLFKSNINQEVKSISASRTKVEPQTQQKSPAKAVNSFAETVRRSKKFYHKSVETNSARQLQTAYSISNSHPHDIKSCEMVIEDQGPPSRTNNSLYRSTEYIRPTVNAAP